MWFWLTCSVRKFNHINVRKYTASRWLMRRTDHMFTSENKIVARNVVPVLPSDFYRKNVGHRDFGTGIEQGDQAWYDRGSKLRFPNDVATWRKFVGKRRLFSIFLHQLYFFHVPMIVHRVEFSSHSKTAFCWSIEFLEPKTLQGQAGWRIYGVACSVSVPQPQTDQLSRLFICTRYIFFTNRLWYVESVHQAGLSLHSKQTFWSPPLKSWIFYNVKERYVTNHACNPIFDIKDTKHGT